MLPDRRDPAYKCHLVLKEVCVQAVEQKCLDIFPGDIWPPLPVAVSPQDDHVKPVGCRGKNNESSFTTAPGWERQSRTHQCCKQGWAAACGSKTESWHLMALGPLCFFTSPQNHKQSLYTLEFCLFCWEIWSRCHMPHYRSSTDKRNSLIIVIYPQHTAAWKWIKLFSQLCLGSCTTSRSLSEGWIWPLISQESHSCCSEYLLPNPLSSWAVFLLQIALKV